MSNDPTKLTDAERREGQNDPIPSLCVGEGELPPDDEKIKDSKPEELLWEGEDPGYGFGV